MKIGLISDTHGSLWGWQRAWDLALHDADVIAHCGDVLYHGPKFEPVEAYDPRALAEAINAVNTPVLIARGNGDSDVDQLVIDVPIQQPYVFAQIEGTRLLATHGHIMTPDGLGPLCERWAIDYLLTGHLHVPSITRHQTCLHINPGTTTYPSHPDETRQRLTCGVIEHGEAWIVDLATGERLTGV